MRFVVDVSLLIVVMFYKLSVELRFLFISQILIETRVLHHLLRVSAAVRMFQNRISKIFQSNVHVRY